MLKRIITKEGYELITIQQAAKMMGVHVQTIYKWMNAELLTPIAKVGYVTLLDKKSVKKAGDSVQKTKPRSGEPVDIKTPPDKVQTAKTRIDLSSQHEA